MSDISSKINIYSHKKSLVFIQTIFLTFFIFLFLGTSSVFSQSQEQIEFAKSLGIDIEDFKGDLEDEISGIGQPMEDFTFELRQEERI